MMSEDIMKQDASTQADFAKLQDDIWNRRQLLYTQLRQMGLQERAFELQQSERNKTDWFGIAKTVLPLIAGVAVAATTRNIPAGLAVAGMSGAGELAARRDGSWFGQGAKTGDSTGASK